MARTTHTKTYGRHNRSSNNNNNGSDDRNDDQNRGGDGDNNDASGRRVPRIRIRRSSVLLASLRRISSAVRQRLAWYVEHREELLVESRAGGRKLPTHWRRLKRFLWFKVRIGIRLSGFSLY